MRLCLVRGIVQISAEHELTHLCAIMERSLLRLLRAIAMHFLPVGPVVEHHGARQPAVSGIGAMLHRMKIEQPAVWALHHRQRGALVRGARKEADFNLDVPSAGVASSAKPSLPAFTMPASNAASSGRNHHCRPTLFADQFHCLRASPVSPN